MSYDLHKTESLVLGGGNSRESDRYFYLLTKDFGLVRAFATGVRELRGKLRYSLQDFSRAEVELVYGKIGWRITNAEFREHFAYPARPERLSGLEAMGRIANLIRRLCKGEEKNEELYVDILNSFSAFTHLPAEASAQVSGTMSFEEVAHLEILTVMRILHHLGYWGENSTLAYYLSGDLNDKTLRESLKPIKLVAVRAINESLKAAQM